MVNQISVHVDQIKHNHNVILASFQNQVTKDETEALMDEVKKTSHRIHNGLKSEFSDVWLNEEWLGENIFWIPTVFPELKGQIEAEQEGPDRNTADFRIKKAQVYMYLYMYVYMLKSSEDLALCSTRVLFHSFSSVQ